MSNASVRHEMVATLNEASAFLSATVTGVMGQAGYAERAEKAGRLGDELAFMALRLSAPDTASPGLPWADIAASAYRAYAASTGNKNFRGDPMPAFADLPQPIKVAWEAAVRQAGDCDEVKPGGVAPDEQHWAGWLPPQFRA